MSTSVGSAHLDITASTSRAKAAIEALVSQSRTQLATLTGINVNVSVKLKAPTRAEAAAVLGGIKAEKVIAIKVDSADAVTRITQIKALLSNLGATVQGLFNVNLSGFSAVLSGGAAMNTQFQATVTQLRTVLEEIRRTRPPTGPPGGGGSSGGSGSGNAQLQQLQRELGIITSQFGRGEAGLKTYLRELERIRTAATAAGTGLAAGSKEAQQLERIMGGLSNATRGINSASITKLRTDLANARAEFERATGAAGRFNFVEQRRATQAYETALRGLETRIRAVGERGTATQAQLRSLGQLSAQLGSQRNAINGIFTQVGLSGSVVNALRSLPQFAAQAGGSLGAAAAQATSFAGGLGGIAATAGPVSIALAGLTVTVGSLLAIMGSSVGAFGTFEQDIQNAKATLGLFGSEGKATGQQLAALAQDPALTKLGFNSNQAAQAIEELGSRGLDTAEILNGGLKTAATLAAASGVKDLTVSSEILVGTMRAFGIEGEAAAKVPDLLANAANVSALKLEDFRLAIAAGGSAARTAGIDVTEFTAVMSLMRDRLISASDAGTSFKAFTAAFTPNTEGAAAAMRQIGFSAFDSTGKMKGLREIVEQLATGLKGYTDEQQLATLETIFGSDGVRTATTLLDAYNTRTREGARLLDERTGALTKQGTADLAAKERTDALVAAQAELSNKVLVLKQRLGEELAPAATTLVTALTGLVDWVGKLGGSADELRGYLVPAGVALLAFRANVVATATAGAWATLSGILVALPGLITALSASLTAFVASNPIGLIATVAAGIAAYANNIISDTQRIYDQIDQDANRSQQALLNRVAQLRAAGDKLSLAKAKVLLAQQGLSQAQEGQITGVDLFGNRTITVDPQAVKAAQMRLEAANKELEAARLNDRAKNPNTLTGQGPLLPGQIRAGAATEVGLRIAEQTLRATGNREADRVVDYCARWVRMTLGKAEPKIADYVNTLFQKDSDGDGTVEASDAQRNAQAAGLLRQFTGIGDLKPGDTVFYQDGGAGHVGIYIGNGKVRGNNRVTNAATGGKNPVGDVDVNRLGKVSGYVRGDDLFGAATGFSGTSLTSDSPNAKLQRALAEGQRLFNQYQLALKSGNDVWLTKVNQSITAFKQKNAEAWKTIEARNKEGAKNTAGVSDAEYKRLQARAGELAALEERTRGKGMAEAAADREIAAWVKRNGDAAQKVLDYERGALKKRTEAERQARTERDTIAREAAQGRLDAARTALERLQTIQARALVQAGDNEVARAKLVRSNANAVAAAQKQIAQAQLKLDEAAARKLAPGNQAQALANAKATYQNTLRDIETERLRSVQDSGRTLKEEQARLDQQVREGRVADARLTLERISLINQQELQRFTGTAAEREKVVRRQADAELAAQKQVALAQKAIDDAAAKALTTPKLRDDALRRSAQTAENTIRQAQIARDNTVQEAKKATAQEVAQAGQRQKAAQNLERDLRQLNERFAQQVRAGTVTADSLLRYRQAVENVRAKAAELPVALQGGITTLLTQGRTLDASGQQVADYRSEIDKLSKSVGDWAYAELVAARARVVANGGDAKKLAILDAEIARRKTLSTQQLDQAGAESRVSQAGASAENLEGEYANAQAAAKGNLATLYQLELQYGGRIQAARDAQARAENDNQIRLINERYDKLGNLEGVSDEQRRELDASRTRDLAANAQRLTNTLAKNLSDRNAAELDAKTRLDDALKSADRQTRDTIRKNALDLLSRQTADLEAAQEAELNEEGLTQAQILEIRKRYQPQLVEQKRREVAASREIEEQAERDRYADAVEAARKDGTLAQVQARLLAEHTSNMGAIQRRGADSVRDYELGTKRAVGQAIVAADKATSDELVEAARTRVEQQLEGLNDFDERQRQVARSALVFWQGVYAGMGKAGEAALAAVDEAIRKLDAAGREARTAAAKVVVQDDTGLKADFGRDLTAVGKDEDADSARASAEAQYKGLLDTYRGFLSKAQEAYKQFDGVADDALTPDERQTRDGLEANMLLFQGFIDRTIVAAGAAGDKAAGAFTQAQADKLADGRLALDEAQYAQAQQDGADGSPAYRAGLNAALAYWRARKAGLAEGTPEYLAALQKITELEGKLQGVSPEKIRDQEQERSEALLEARQALAEAEGRDGGPAYRAGLNAALAYWRGRLTGLTEGTPEYLTALQKITDLEGKVSSLNANSPLVQGLKQASTILGKGGPLQSALSAGLDGMSAFFSAGGKGGGRGAILQGAAAFVGGLVDVFKTGDEDVDSVVSTFVSGIQGVLSQLATGNWMGAIITGAATLVSTVIDIFRGGANSAKKAAEEVASATKSVKFFDTSKYAKVVSRGGFWGWLGFKKTEIDQEALDIAQTLGDALYSSISQGMLDGIKAGKTSFSDLGLDLRAGLSQQILQGLIDGFLKGAVMQGLLQPFLDKYVEAMRSGNAQALAEAANGIQQAAVNANGALQDFYQNVLVPTAQSLGQFGTDDTSSSVGGSAAADLGLAQAPTAVAAAPAWALDFTGQLGELTPVLRDLTPALQALSREGIAVRAQAELTVNSPRSDLSYALNP